MPEIMIRCPTLGYAVRTGLRTEAVKLESLERTVPIPLRCPACRKLHKWQRRDAWADTGCGYDRSHTREASSLTRDGSWPGVPTRRPVPPLWFWDSV